MIFVIRNKDPFRPKASRNCGSRGTNLRNKTVFVFPPHLKNQVNYANWTHADLKNRWLCLKRSVNTWGKNKTYCSLSLLLHDSDVWVNEKENPKLCLTNQQRSSLWTLPPKFLYFWKVLPLQQELLWGKTISLKLNLDPGPSDGNAGRGTEFLKRFLVLGESSCSVKAVWVQYPLSFNSGLVSTSPWENYLSL